MTIDEDGSDISYFSTVKFGSKGKPLRMLLDTGAANTWVMSTDCSSKACGKHETYGSSDSDTLKTTSMSWKVSYGTGSVSGQIINDTISFAGFSIPMFFGAAAQVSDDFLAYTMDGILGLGRSSQTEIPLPTIMGTLASQGNIKANLFGISLQRRSDGGSDGEITFGDVDKSKYSGDVSFTNTLSKDGLWEISVDDAGFDGKGAKFTGKTAIIDTGTSFILMPPDDAKKLHDLIPKSTQVGDANYQVPCSTTANVQFTFSGVTFDIPPKDYVGSKAESGLCNSNIAGHQPFGVNQWLMGDTFLKSVYTVFDLDKNRIGRCFSISASQLRCLLSFSRLCEEIDGFFGDLIIIVILFFYFHVAVIRLFKYLNWWVPNFWSFHLQLFLGNPDDGSWLVDDHVDDDTCPIDPNRHGHQINNASVVWATSHDDN